MLPSGYVKLAFENGPVEIVDLPIENGGSFHSYVTVYQRVRPIGKTILDPFVVPGMGSMGSLPCPLLATVRLSASPAVWKTYQWG